MVHIVVESGMKVPQYCHIFATFDTPLPHHCHTDATKKEGDCSPSYPKRVPQTGQVDTPEATLLPQFGHTLVFPSTPLAGLVPLLPLILLE